MLQERYFSFIISVVITVSSMINAQAKFPVGVYSNIQAGGTSDHVFLDSIKSLGANWIIHESRNSNKAKLESNFDSLILSNCSVADTDAIHYYSSGCYSKWEAEENVADGNIGIKHDFGHDTTVGGITCWTSQNNTANRGSFLIRGPNYYQDIKYKIPETGGYITYKLNMRLKRGNEYLGGSLDTLALVYVTYNNTMLADPFVIYVNQVTSSFSIKTLTYNCSAFPKTEGNINNSSSHMNRYSAIKQDNENVQFKIKWFGNYVLLVDYIEVMDVEIWENYLSNTSAVLSKIQTQLNKFSSWPKVKYFYSLDEPSSQDNYIPYKTIQDVVLSYQYGKPLITALVPIDPYTNVFHGEKSIPKWINTATPQKLMFDLYPFNIHCSGTSDVEKISGQFNFLRDVCRAANKYDKNNYFYVAQVHGYTLSTNSDAELHQPTENEFRAASLLALAHGAKGLFYYCYKSSSANNPSTGASETVTGLVDAYGNKSSLWNAVKNFNSRLHGSFGDKLLNLEYNNAHLRIAWNIDSLQTLQDSESCSYLTIQKPSGGSQAKGIFHCGLLSPGYPDSVDTKYFLLLNELTPDVYSQAVTITANKPASFANYTMKDVEGNFNDSYTTTLTKNVTISAGNGYLFCIGPTIKIGGTLTANETISSATTLNGAMTIATGCTLTVNSTYTINNDITLQGTGKIQFGYSGNIVLNNGARIINSSWNTALLRGNASQKPKLIWSPYTGSGTVTGYEIYRKYETSNFDYLASVGANQ